MLQKSYYTVNEVAKIVGVTPFTVRKKIKIGELSANVPKNNRVGYKISKEALEDWIKNTKKGMIDIRDETNTDTEDENNNIKFLALKKEVLELECEKMRLQLQLKAAGLL